MAEKLVAVLGSPVKEVAPMILVGLALGDGVPLSTWGLMPVRRRTGNSGGGHASPGQWLRREDGGRC